VHVDDGEIKNLSNGEKLFLNLFGVCVEKHVDPSQLSMWMPC
jgi:hypothetical protein